jgi:single-strand DNA-binding protein
MTAQKIEDSVAAAGGAESDNVVQLRGRVLEPPVMRQLSTGETVVNVRVSVDRTGAPAERQRRDQIDCALWSTESRLRRRVLDLREEDVVEVVGALHRRFFQAGGTTMSRTEVEISRLKVARRAKT